MYQWTFQHSETGSFITRNPMDLPGLRFLAECGYTWVNRQDGLGWRPTSLVAHETSQLTSYR